MLICESEFKREDPNHPEYSLTEIDSAIFDEEFYQLRLRKNLKTGEFEVYKHSFKDKTDQIVSRSIHLGNVLRKLNEEVKHHPRQSWGPYRVCTHKGGERAAGCQVSRPTQT